MLTLLTLRSLLAYSPETGAFHWKIDQTGGTRAGMMAGRIHKRGYRVISIQNRKYTCGRLAWFHMTGQWPAGPVDHLDRDRTNNRWGNLRLATDSLNNANTPARRNNASGFKGVSLVKRSGRYAARIKRQHIGYFSTPEAAAMAYDAAALEAWGGFAYLNFP